jgi:hypothetical protein
MSPRGLFRRRNIRAPSSIAGGMGSLLVFVRAALLDPAALPATVLHPNGH